jgi:predicted nucleotidyltransferase
MCPFDSEIETIKDQIINMYHPLDIILFGSCAKGRVTRGSDIDLCLILDTNNKRKTIQDILVNLDHDVDLVIYTPEEWRKYKDDLATFAGIIKKTGVSLIG